MRSVACLAGPLLACAAVCVLGINEPRAQTPGVLLLGSESDADHNRSVITFAGESDAVIEGSVRGARKAADLINLSHHQGVHPRVGAADVIPFIPLQGSTMQDAIHAARMAGEEIWQRKAFCRLGDGDLDVEAVLDSLRSGYEGWLVVEQDVLPDPDDPLGAPARDQRANRQFLNARGF